MTTTLPTPTRPLMPTPDAHQLAAAALSPRTRAAHVALLLVASAAGIGLLSLWLTEPSLPARTHAAFAVMTVMAASWVAYASWVLTRRHVLFARQRVVAGWMSVTFSACFVAGTLAVGATSGGRATLMAAALGAPMLLLAIVLLVRARRVHARLLERRRELATSAADTGR
ncbi:MAG: hypothetical protein IT182_15470 [Acidobacteria bacterium]|nr:hypothetical protein [Acidobacteriota bacterium]